jgi:hypothetical protein
LPGIHELVSPRPLVLSGQCSPVTRPIESLSMIENENTEMNGDVCIVVTQPVTRPIESLSMIENENTKMNGYAHIVVTPAKSDRTIGMILEDQPYPYFGGKEWSIGELRLIHKDVFLPLQAGLQSKGGLVIDNGNFFK